MSGAHDERASIDWDARGVLSIVVQGPVFAKNLAETANHCLHWRQLFPMAEVILVVSTTDVLAGGLHEGVYDGLRLAPRHASDLSLQAAVDVIARSCDRVGLAEGVLPLPPIKSDSASANNVNFQIAAARHGLALARGEFVLRVRSDLIFLDRSFLDQYDPAHRKPRGDAAVFARRVMISWLFTLNPFTNERLPLHFSDWFHFGLTADVRRLWDVPYVTLRDSIHYRAHRHVAGSNTPERRFYTRLAVEQHIVYSCFKHAFPALVLDYHNDASSLALSLDILVDNFVVCDLAGAKCIFDKYAAEMDHYANRLHCITREDWCAMADARDSDPRLTLAGKIKAFAEHSVGMLDEGLPRTYSASRLTMKDGALLNGEAVATGREGVLFSGPKITLPAGRYRVRLDVTTIEGHGSLAIRVTAGSGRALLAEKAIQSGPGVSYDAIFDVGAMRVTDLEVTCEFAGVQALSVAGLTLTTRDGDVQPAPLYQQSLPRLFPATSLSTRIGSYADGQIVASGQDGVLFYGPYALFSPGRYLAKVDVTSLAGTGALTLRVTTNFGADVLASKRFAVGGGTAPAPEIAFDIPGKASTKLEVVCNTTGLRQIGVASLVISERAAHSGRRTAPHRAAYRSILGRIGLGPSGT